ncbi:hypothetical protein D3C72_1203690 [compost metagenome]
MQHIELIAKVSADAVKSFSDAIGDVNEKSWENSSPEEKNRIVDGVIFRINNPDATYAELYDSLTQTDEAVKIDDEDNFKLKNYLFFSVVDTLKGMQFK